jgi:hypothetical protein
MKAFLQESEPGLDLVETEGSPYVILRNSRSTNGDTTKDEAKEEEDDSHTDVSQVCRSVVWNTETNRPCCVAPFAARRDQKIPLNTSLRVEDFVEGVMINVFRSKNDTDLQVASRSRVDAGGKFYSEKSFREMFDEALQAKNSSLEDLNTLMVPSGEMEEGVVTTFCSLVMAHPEHRVVRTVHEANLWLIYRGSVLEDGTVQFSTENLPADWTPKVYSEDFQVTEWSEMKAKFEEIRKTNRWFWQGLVVHTGAGTERWRFRNGAHDRVRRDLRGMESNPLARFLRLRAEKRVQGYLRVYSEDNELFQSLERDYRAATKTLYTWYCRCHKEHSVVFKSMPKSVQPLVFELHKHYLGTLRPKNYTLRLAETIAWIPEYFKTPFGISNMLRFMKEAEQPPPSRGSQVKPTLDTDVPEDQHSAAAPVSPVDGQDQDV